MKKITFFINSLEIGGTEKQLLQLIKESRTGFLLIYFVLERENFITTF